MLSPAHLDLWVKCGVARWLHRRRPMDHEFAPKVGLVLGDEIAQIEQVGEAAPHMTEQLSPLNVPFSRRYTRAPSRNRTAPK
jgi:hypothetical protein